MGLGRPSVIYVKNFAYYRQSEPSRKFKKQTSDVYNINPGSLKNKPQHVYNVNGSNTNLNNHTNLSKNQSINQTNRTETIDLNSLKTEIKNRIELDYLQRKYPDKKMELQELCDIIIEVLVSRKKSFRLAKEDMPAETVKQVFADLECQHIEYVLDCLRKNTSEVKNTKAYLQTALWNANKTINNHYSLDAQNFINDKMGIDL